LIKLREGSRVAWVCATDTLDGEASIASVFAPNLAIDWANPQLYGFSEKTFKDL